MFLQELIQKSGQDKIPAVDIAKAFIARIEAVRPLIDAGWQHRLDSAVAMLSENVAIEVPVGLSHGDFTPWNTYLVGGRLYVFDWEYAQENTAISNDIIHFILNKPVNRVRSANKKLEILRRELGLNFEKNCLLHIILIYTIGQVFLQLERLAPSKNKVSVWDGSFEQSKMIDELIMQAGFQR
jgi:RIO-like serine/threonine protein kinase